MIKYRKYIAKIKSYKTKCTFKKRMLYYFEIKFFLYKSESWTLNKKKTIPQTCKKNGTPTGSRTTQWFFTKVNIKYLFEEVIPNNIAPKNWAIYLKLFLHRALQNKLHSFWFPTTNFARICINLLVSWLLDVDELA